MIMIMIIAIKVKNSPESFWFFLKNTFYNVDNVST